MAKTPKDPSRQGPARPPTTEEGPQAVTAGAAAVTSAVGGTGVAREVDARLADGLSAVAPPPEDDPGLLGRPGRDDVDERKPGADLLEDASASPSSSDPRDRLGASPFADATSTPGVEAPDAAEAGVFDLLDQPGATDGDPLSNFLGAAEGKLGRGTGLSDPSDQTNASPAHGQHSAAADGEPLGPPTLEQFEARQGVFIGPREEVRFWPGTPPVGTPREIAEVFDAIDDDPAPAPADDPEEDPDDHEDEVTGEADPPHEPPPSPGPEEHAPLPQDLQDQLDADVARFGRLRRTGDDGATDPSEIESEAVGPVGALPTHAELGESLFGQPVGGAAPTTGGGNVNPGADGQGAGVVTPGDDQSFDVGAGRDDDPFADAATLEPPVGADEPDADAVSIVPSAVESPVSDDPDLPDAIGP